MDAEIQELENIQIDHKRWITECSKNKNNKQLMEKLEIKNFKDLRKCEEKWLYDWLLQTTK